MTLSTKQANQILKSNPHLKTLVHRREPGPVRILIVVSGGTVQQVFADNRNVHVLIKDWDDIKQSLAPEAPRTPAWQEADFRSGSMLDREATAGVRKYRPVNGVNHG